MTHPSQELDFVERSLLVGVHDEVHGINRVLPVFITFARSNDFAISGFKTPPPLSTRLIELEFHANLPN